VSGRETNSIYGRSDLNNPPTRSEWVAWACFAYGNASVIISNRGHDVSVVAFHHVPSIVCILGWDAYVSPVYAESGLESILDEIARSIEDWSGDINHEAGVIEN